jgi:hypothetical protein
MQRRVGRNLSAAASAALPEATGGVVKMASTPAHLSSHGRDAAKNAFPAVTTPHDASLARPAS